MRKKSIVIIFILIAASVFALTGCGSNTLTLTSFGNGFGLEYDNTCDYPVEIIKSRIGLLSFSNEYRRYTDFESKGDNAMSVDSKFEQFDAGFFKNHYLAVKLTQNGAGLSSYKAAYEINGGVLNVTVTTKKSSTANCQVLLGLLVLEVPISIEFDTLNFIIL